MYHDDPIFTLPREWESLIYFKRSFKTFAIWVWESVTHAEHKMQGRYRYHGNIGLEIELDSTRGRLGLDLKADPTAPLLNRMFGTAPLIGTVTSGEQEIVSCVVQNSHDLDHPVIRVKNRAPVWVMEAYRVQPKWVVSPLGVVGVQGFEMLLEDYALVGKAGRTALPDNSLKRYFAGSYRSAQKPSCDLLDGIGMIVAITELLVRDYYMSVIG